MVRFVLTCAVCLFAIQDSPAAPPAAARARRLQPSGESRSKQLCKRREFEFRQSSDRNGR